MRAILDPLLERLEAHYGVKPILYVTYRSYYRYIAGGGYGDYPIWCSSPTVFPLVPGWDFWQYSHSAELEGYYGTQRRIDLNIFRGGQTFDGLFDALHELHRMGCAYKILFVEASVETIIKRYKETRRMHPLSSTSRSLDEAVRQERTVLAPVRQRAEYIIDTSALSTAKLRGEVLRLFGDGGSTPAMSVSVISFGFKYGIPIEADLVFDVRFLPNPYYIAELRHQTGLDEGVYSFVFGYQQTKDFMAHLESLIGFLLPQYVEEGKAALVIGIGCTGGQHRSVAITKALADFIKQKGYQATENHRDMTRA